MKRVWKLISYLVLGLVSFTFFFYLTFPYEVLKETIVLNASEATGLNVHIGELGPSFPLGVKSESVRIGSSTGNKVQLSKVNISISTFALLLGNLSLHVDLEDAKKGTFELNVGISIFDLLKGQYPVWPKSIYLEARAFLFGEIVDFVLKNQSESPDVNPLVKPLLESVDVDGQLNADVDLSIDSSDLTKSSGTAEIRLTKTVLKSLNDNLPLPDQIFSKALIKAKLDKGALFVDKSSGFVSQDLNIGIGGKIIQKPQLDKSDLDFNIPIKLGPPLQEQLGIILDAVAQRQTKGELEIKVTGALDPGPHISFL